MPTTRSDHPLQQKRIRVNTKQLGCGLLTLLSVVALSLTIRPFTSPQVDRLKLVSDSATPVPPTPITAATPSHADQSWLIPGDLGTTHHLTGTLEVNAGDSASRIFMQVSGLVPPSPNSSSRSILMKVDCTQPEGIAVRWHYEPFSYDLSGSSSEDYACGDSTPIVFSFDANYRWLVFDSAFGEAREIVYSLTATVHSVN